MSFHIRELLVGLGLVLLIASMSPAALAIPAELAAQISEERSYLKDWWRGCNAEGKLCGMSAGNQLDCCGNKVCLFVQEQNGYYCLIDPTMPYIPTGILFDR